jgi:hypothetical protein
MLHVNQRRIGRFGFVIPLASRRFAAGILRRRDNFKILVLQLFVNFLPAWQIKSASSPGRPSDHQHLFAAKIIQVDDLPLAIGHREIRRDS